MRHTYVSPPFISVSSASQTLIFGFFTTTNNQMKKNKIQASLTIFVLGDSAACLYDSVTYFLVSHMQPEMQESDVLFVLETNKVMMVKKS